MGEVGASNIPVNPATELLTTTLKLCQSDHASRGLVLRQTLEIRQSSIIQWVYSFSGGLGNIFINLDTGRVEEVEGALAAAAQEKIKTAERFFRGGEFEEAWIFSAMASVMDGCKAEGAKLRKKIEDKIYILL